MIVFLNHVYLFVFQLHLYGASVLHVIPRVVHALVHACHLVDACREVPFQCPKCAFLARESSFASPSFRVLAL